MHRQNFELPRQEHTVEELSVDGGNKRDRTPKGEICAWLGYKAISVHHNGTIGTSFQDNQVVIDWVNDQPLASTVHHQRGQNKIVKTRQINTTRHNKRSAYD